MEYLVTNTKTGAQQWVEAISAPAALYKHSGLPGGSAISFYSQGSVLDLSIADSAIRGRRIWVERQNATG